MKSLSLYHGTQPEFGSLRQRFVMHFEQLSHATRACVSDFPPSCHATTPHDNGIPIPQSNENHNFNQPTSPATPFPH